MREGDVGRRGRHQERTPKEIIRGIEVCRRSPERILMFRLVFSGLRNDIVRSGISRVGDEAESHWDSMTRGLYTLNFDGLFQKSLEIVGRNVGGWIVW